MTTTPAWYVPPVSDEAERLAAAVRAQGLDLLAEDFPWPRRPIVYYGTVEGIQKVTRNPSNYRPFVNWCDWDALRPSRFMTRWGGELLSRKYGFYPLGELRRLGAQLWSWYYSDVYPGLFVRPDSAAKPFDGMLVAAQNLPLWLAPATRGLPDELWCLVASPERVSAEYRIVVAAGEPVAASRYLVDDRLDETPGAPAGALELAARVARRWAPHPAFVLDVAEVPGGHGFRVVEANSVHSSGLYGCDRGAVVAALTRLAALEKIPD